MPNLKTASLEPRQRWRKQHDTVTIQTPQTLLHVCFHIPKIDESSKPQVINKLYPMAYILFPAVNKKPDISMESGISIANTNSASGETREAVSARCTIESILLNTCKIGLEYNTERYVGLTCQWAGSQRILYHETSFDVPDVYIVLDNRIFFIGS
ncbi:hypothetical protein VTP01DRAFT_9468 [Rhizomucor pusillus]|uniref:uncharacterized protein n=1 Tax=Rhizomucor pusillus TaxID=4840 RepID=UPI00374313AB